MAKKRRGRKALVWLTKSPVIILAFALGSLTGMFLKLPLIPYVLPEPAEKLFAAMIGTLGAMGGALMLWRLQQQHDAKAAYFLFRSIFVPSRVVLKQCINRIDRAQGARILADYPPSCFGALERLLTDAVGQMERFASATLKLNPRESFSFVTIELGARNVLEKIKSYGELMGNDQLEDALQKFIDLREGMRGLEEAFVADHEIASNLP